MGFKLNLMKLEKCESWKCEVNILEVLSWKHFSASFFVVTKWTYDWKLMGT